MAKNYVVSRAFRGSVSKEDKTPQVIQTKAGDCHKYMVQFEGEEDKGWIQILRKIENGDSRPVEKGDVLYGSLSENNWGKYDFKREQRPEGQPAPQTGSSKAAPSSGGSVDKKLDYIISLLENANQFQGHDEGRTTIGDISPTDIDDGPVDLSSLEY